MFASWLSLLFELHSRILCFAELHGKMNDTSARDEAPSYDTETATLAYLMAEAALIDDPLHFPDNDDAIDCDTLGFATEVLHNGNSGANSNAAASAWLFEGAERGTKSRSVSIDLIRWL